MSIEAFLRQGFIPFRDAVGSETKVLASIAPELSERATAVARALGTPTQVTFVGIGASLGALAAPVAYLSANGVPSIRVNAGEVGEAKLGGTVVALSQSGRSRETVAVMRNATGPKLAVVNVTGSPLTAAADATLTLGDLSDSLASTIGFTASVMAVSMLCEIWKTGAVSPSWLTLGERAQAFLEANPETIRIVANLISRSAFLDFVAPYEHMGIAEANALLIREVVRVPAAPFETRQYLHGLMEATNAATAHILIQGPDDGQIVKALSSLHDDNIVEFRMAGASGAGKAVITVDVAIQSPLELPVFIALFMQQAVLASAVGRGIDPDEFLFLDTGTKLDDSE
jgi:fructoselysine-6-P-deglycase FrlB-like protein